MAAGDARAQSYAFPASEGEIRTAVCPARGSCRIGPIVDAGRHGTTSLAVVRAWSGPLRCCEQPGYRDYLVSSRSGVVRRERLLVRGACACLEWALSSWSYRHGELIFTYGGMGAPPAVAIDLRPTTLHVRPWPLAITASFRGDERDPETPTMPARAPMVVLSME